MSVTHQPGKSVTYQPGLFVYDQPGLHRGGVRRCLGLSFSQYEMKITLGTLLTRFRFALASDRAIESVRRSVTLGPRGGVPMVLLGSRTAPSTSDQIHTNAA